MFSTFSALSAPTHALLSSRRTNLRACDQCRRLKIKCPNPRYSGKIEQHCPSSCGQCLRAGLKCTYTEIPAKRGRPRKQELRVPENKLSEQVLHLNYTPRPGSCFVAYKDVENSVESDQIMLSQNSPGHLVPAHRTATHESTSEEHTTDITHLANEMTSTSFHPDSTRKSNSLLRLVDDIWVDIDEFFDTLYIIFPIVSYYDLTSRLIIEPDWTTVPDLRTLLLALRLLNSAGRYRMQAANETNLLDLIRLVETSRLSHDFAENITLDAIVCSLCLFVAYNVLEKHNRAFLYLDEAFSLFETVSPFVGLEEQRRLNIEQILFNTEVSTHAIYAPRGRMLRARVPLMDSGQDLIAFATNTRINKTAVHLLKSLTLVNLAQNADVLDDISEGGKFDAELLYGAGLQHHRYSRIQAADVAVTRQWRISSKLVAGKTKGKATGIALQSITERLGVTVMSWICLLREGELRIVGLGKLAELAKNIRILEGPAVSQQIVAGLTGAIMKEDYDRKFAPSLTGLIASIVTSLPMSLGSLELQPEHTIESSVILPEDDIVDVADVVLYSGLQNSDRTMRNNSDLPHQIDDEQAGSNLQYWDFQLNGEQQPVIGDTISMSRTEDYGENEIDWLADILEPTLS